MGLKQLKSEKLRELKYKEKYIILWEYNNKWDNISDVNQM